MNIRIQRFFVTMITMFLLAGTASYSNAAQEVALPDGSKVELPAICPVCEMKIESDSAVLGVLVFAEGKVVLFDNISEFFRYLLSPQTFGFDPNNIKNHSWLIMNPKNLLTLNIRSMLLDRKKCP